MHILVDWSHFWSRSFSNWQLIFCRWFSAPKRGLALNSKAGRLDESYCWRKIFRWIKILTYANVTYKKPFKILSILCSSMLWPNANDNSVFHESLIFMKLVLIHHLRTTDKQVARELLCKAWATHPEDQLAERTVASELFKPKSPWTGQDMVWAS